MHPPLQLGVCAQLHQRLHHLLMPRVDRQMQRGHLVPAQILGEAVHVHPGVEQLLDHAHVTSGGRVVEGGLVGGPDVPAGPREELVPVVEDLLELVEVVGHDGQAEVFEHIHGFDHLVSVFAKKWRYHIFEKYVCIISWPFPDFLQPKYVRTRTTGSHTYQKGASN